MHIIKDSFYEAKIFKIAVEIKACEPEVTLIAAFSMVNFLMNVNHMLRLYNSRASMIESFSLF